MAKYVKKIINNIPFQDSLPQDPIFIVGYPRSGTTLLQVLLATQGDIVTFPETHFFSTIFAVRAYQSDTIDISSAVNLLKNISKKSGIETDSNFITHLEDIQSSGLIPIKELFEALVKNLLPSDAQPGCRWLEKTPDHGLFLEEILRFYPEAKFISIIRNPFNAIYSRTKYFPPRAKNLVTVLSKQWVNHIQALDSFQSKHPNTALAIRYEDLIQNPTAAIRKICTFLGIEFKKDKLGEYQQQARHAIQPFEHWKSDVKALPIYTRDENPHHLFSRLETIKIELIVRHKMQRYGYKPRHPILMSIFRFFA